MKQVVVISEGKMAYLTQEAWAIERSLAMRTLKDLGSRWTMTVTASWARARGGLFLGVSVGIIRVCVHGC